MRRHVQPGNHAAESFVSCIRLFGGVPPLAGRRSRVGHATDPGTCAAHRMVPPQCSDIHDAPRNSAGTAHKVAWNPQEEVGSSIVTIFSGASTYAGAPGAGEPVVGNRHAPSPALHRRGMSGSER